MSVFYSTTAPRGPGPPHYRNFTITLETYERGAELLCMNDQLDARTSTWQHLTTPTRDRQPFLRRDSNPQSQQAKDHGSTPRSERPLGSAKYLLTECKSTFYVDKSLLQQHKRSQVSCTYYFVFSGLAIWPVPIWNYFVPPGLKTSGGTTWTWVSPTQGRLSAVVATKPGFRINIHLPRGIWISYSPYSKQSRPTHRRAGAHYF